MTNSMTAGLEPTHPGEVLREIVVPATGRTPSALARMLGISRQHFHDILAIRKPVSPQVALRLAKLFGGEADTWVRMQAAYDLRRARDAMTEELERIPVLEAA